MACAPPVAEQRFVLEQIVGMADLAATAGRMERAAARFFLEQIVPEALGLRASAIASARLLCALAPEEFAA